jgi:hypothetical protein
MQALFWVANERIAPMASISGHRLRLSPQRRLVCDLLHASRNVPLVSFERRMQLECVLNARKSLTNPPSWVLIFTKAYALVAAKRPELRRAYLSRPWPHLWEADENVAAVAIEREYHGEAGVFFGFLRGPEHQTLPGMVAELAKWRTEPVESIRPFRRCLKYARLPLPVRRFLWWYATSWSGHIKARNFGTFAVSVTASAGATGLNLISPVSTTLNYGQFSTDGSLDVRLHFDHRVLDGVPVSKALVELEETLCGPIVDELRSMAGEQPRDVWAERGRVPEFGL